MKRYAAIVGMAGLVGSGWAWAGKPAKEPEYASQKPLYGKIAFDLEGKTVICSKHKSVPTDVKVELVAE